MCFDNDVDDMRADYRACLKLVTVNEVFTKIMLK